MRVDEERRDDDMAGAPGRAGVGEARRGAARTAAAAELGGGGGVAVAAEGAEVLGPLAAEPAVGPMVDGERGLAALAM
jgi:hypothetical protein